MSDPEIESIIKAYYSPVEQTVYPRAKLEAGAGHILDVLKGNITAPVNASASTEGAPVAPADPDEAALNFQPDENEVGTLPVDEQSEKGIASANLIDEFFNAKTPHQKLALLQIITADSKYDNASIHPDLKKAAQDAMAEIKARTAAYSAFAQHVEKNPPPPPGELLAAEPLKPILPLLSMLKDSFPLITGGKDDSIEEYDEIIVKLFKREDSKIGRLALLKYLYKSCVSPGVKKYFSGKFSAEQKKGEPDLKNITEKNLKEFNKFAHIPD